MNQFTCECCGSHKGTHSAIWFDNFRMTYVRCDLCGTRTKPVREVVVEEQQPKKEGE